MNAVALGKQLVILAHTLAGAAMFGTMFYRLFVLRPRSERFFSNDRDFEDFELTLAAGMRWLVLGSLALIIATGGLLAWLTDKSSTTWWLLLLGKTILALTAVVVFIFVSWWLWPRRQFALAAELPGLRRLFARFAWTMFFLVSAGMVLGLLAAAC